MRTTRALAAAVVGGSLVLAPACSDEDGDGAETDEEIEDLENEAEDLGDEVEDEIEGQNEGSNEDGE